MDKDNLMHYKNKLIKNMIDLSIEDCAELLEEIRVTHDNLFVWNINTKQVDKIENISINGDIIQLNTVKYKTKEININEFIQELGNNILEEIGKICALAKQYTRAERNEAAAEIQGLKHALALMAFIERKLKNGS